MTISVKKNNQWLSVKNIYNYQNNQWKAIKQGYVKRSGIWQRFWQNAIIFINDTPQTSISIFELMGNPTTTGNYIFINNAEIIANYGEPALRTGIFPKKSKLTIINNSYIRGYGGNGGNSQTDGEPGGDAIFLEYPCRIDNSNGYLYAGGGGGGGFYAAYSNNIYKSGGGGGAGSIYGNPGENHSKPSGTAYYGSNPLSGNGSFGGIGGYAGYITGGGANTRYDAGEGGTLGEAGIASKLTSGTAKQIEQLYAGGAAGLAICKNNFEVTVLNTNEENIKGEIR